MRCENCPDATATAVVEAPAPTSPYTRRVPVCDLCAAGLAVIAPSWPQTPLPREA